MLFQFLMLPLLMSAQNVAINRIEPSNWWIGMKYNTVTLLLYGHNISDLNPIIEYPGVEWISTEKVTNKNYVFITLKINDNAKAGNILLKFYDAEKLAITKEFPILKREKNSAQRESFSQEDAILLIFPDRFSNGDINNDSFINLNEKTVDRTNDDMRHGGDIQGIINHLDYIESLGFTQIWNTPLIENNQPQYSYHGYAATDFYKIDPRFGTNEQFKTLVQKAKTKGIGVIWDVVLNHCGSEYYFIKDLPSDDWANFSNTKTRTNHLKTTITDIYATEIDKKEYTDGWFDGHMADLNQRNPLVAKYLTQNTIWWVEYAGLSGFRVDTFSYSDKDFLAYWTKTITEEYPNFNIVGEEMTTIADLTSYWQVDKDNNDGYKCYLPTLMDFSLNNNIVSSLNQSNEWFSTWRDVYQSIAQDYQFPHPYDQLIFPDNHDVDRFYSRLNKNIDNWKLGMAMYMTMRGIPQFFYGTEILMTNEKAGSDGQRRGDFYGGWQHDLKNAQTGVGLTKDEKEAQHYFTHLLNWRKNNSLFTSAKFKHYAPEKNDVYIYFRYNDEQKIMVILNKNSNSVSLDINRYKEMVNNNFVAKEVISNQVLHINNSLEIPAKTSMILEIEKE
ncbi:glycosidase [Flavobacteriaceae bacterium MAR_2010_72]|nr:glycosidase [Flavobacteriaceae bacterium MAR_2010_72]